MADPTDPVPADRRWSPISGPDVFGPSLLRRMLGRAWESLPRRARSELATPAIDIAENERAYVATVELAGCKPEDVNVEVHDGLLTIRGHKRSERSGETERSRWTERSFGSFRRAFHLPEAAAPAGVEVSFKEGVLTIEIAKTEESQPG